MREAGCGDEGRGDGRGKEERRAVETGEEKTKTKTGRRGKEIRALKTWKEKQENGKKEIRVLKTEGEKKTGKKKERRR